MRYNTSPRFLKVLAQSGKHPNVKLLMGANCTKGAKVTKMEPRKNISEQMAEANPRTKIPDSEIMIENIIQGSPQFVPYKIKTPVRNSKGMGVKEVKMNIMNSDSEMARTKKTLTAKQRAAWARKAARATKTAHKQGSGQGARPKPH